MMKRPYKAPRIQTIDVQFGVYGDYGAAGGDETFTGGPATLPGVGGWGQNGES